MNALAESLIYAVRRIDAKPSTDEDSDMTILESITATLQSASADEKAVLMLDASFVSAACSRQPLNPRKHQTKNRFNEIAGYPSKFFIKRFVCG